ncbi:MAG: hypothetical protein SF123_25190, partial [Chloroflexota bacterium]|nr:hypothetical protein [Chloroflexota bacterium]
MMQFPRLLMFLLAAGVVVLTGCQTSSEPPSVAVRPTDSPERAAIIAADPNLVAGQRTYNMYCAHCHGYAGEGQLAATVPNTQQLGLHTVPPHDA